MNKLQITMLEQLQNADKLNAVSQLAASVAHEIRNPMTTIRGFLQIMKDENNLTSKQGMFISVSLDELDRTQKIIGDFLSLARPATHLCESIPLSDTLKDVAEFMQPYAVMSKVNLLTDIENNIIINGNINECKQLFINLIKNPVIIAILVGMSCILLGIHLPSKLGQALELLGRTASPLALFAIGGSLVGIGITAVNLQSVLLAGFNVILMPVVIFGLFLLLPNVSQEMLYAGTLITALPMPIAFGIFGQAYGLNERALTPLMISTIIGFIGVSGLIALWW